MFNSQHAQDHCFHFTALGDSIAFGFGATLDIGYVFYFRDFLATLYPCVNLSNRAKVGFTSSDLLDQLQTDAATRAAVKNANFITISIGGADLVDCLLSANIPVCLSNAVATFAADWPLIINEIRKRIRSHAEIYVMTVYNPFRGDDPNFYTVDFYIQQINNVIKANRYRYHYKVVDIHQGFLGKFTNTTQWKVCTWTHFCETAVHLNPPNPHPTNSGHLEIARIHELVFLQHHPGKLNQAYHEDERGDAKNRPLP